MIKTGEYLRFEEFAEACKTYRYIGLCYGASGVGKTHSAWHYAKYSTTERDQNAPIDPEDAQNAKAIIYTADVLNSPGKVYKILHHKMYLYGCAILRDQGIHDMTYMATKAVEQCPLVIIDEVDRLSYNSLELIRQLYDQYQFGLILIGMNGIQNKMMQLPQFYSRIGFAHQYQQLQKSDLTTAITQLALELELNLGVNDTHKKYTIDKIITTCRGNFRILDRLLSQMKRIQTINDMPYADELTLNAAKKLLISGL
jgi:hypothetical protein